MKILINEIELIIHLLYGLSLRIFGLENLKIKSIKKSWIEIKGKDGYDNSHPLSKESLIV